MAIDTMYNPEFTSPTTISRELYTNVGSSSFTLGDYTVYDFDSDTLEIWTAAVAGTQLTEGTDYVLEIINSELDSKKTGSIGTIKTRVRIINATYQTGNIYITYDIIGSEITAEVLNELQTQISGAAALPIGLYFPVDADHSAITFSLPTGFAYGNGQLISDATSVYNGKRLRNLNGGSFVISALAWTADAGGSYATIAAQDLDAVNVGDTVSGSGIAAGSFINDITAGVATITDVSASGAIDTTITGIKRYITGDSTSGGSVNDAMQQVTGSLVKTASIGLLDTESATVASGALSIGDETNNRRGGSESNTNASELYFDNADSISPNPAKTDESRTHGAELDFVYITRIK